MTIALELSAQYERTITRKMVRLACERLGIESWPDGPRHGVTAYTVALPLAVHPADIRYEHERRPRGPAPTTSLLVAQIRALHDAELADDTNGYDDALLGLSSAAKLIWDHRQRVRGA
jgi:hypothetical protein